MILGRDSIVSTSDEEEQQDSVARLNAHSADTVLETLGITITEASKERVVATMPIGTKHHQVLGYLHGGVSVLLAETVASLASAMHIDVKRQSAFGLEINANH